MYFSKWSVFLKSGQLVTGTTSLLYKGSDGTSRSINPDNYQPKGSYAAASHNHSASNITSGTLAVARGGTGQTSVDTTPTSGSKKMCTSGGIYTAINDLKTSVSNGKSAVASAITDKGVSTSATASFDTMANNIRSINQGLTIQYIGELYTSSMPSNHLNKTYSISGYLTAPYSIYLGSNNTYTSPLTKFTSMTVYDPYWGYITLKLESGETINYFSGGYPSGSFNTNYNRYLLITNGMTSTIKNELATIGFKCYTWK